MANRLRPYVILTILGLLFFGELVLHPTDVLYSDHSDLLAMHLPMKRFLVRSWQETGEIPLWCPYSFAGMPFIHDVQVAAFYPLHLPLYYLPEEWIGAAMSWLVVLHVLIAGWCMFAYAGSKGLEDTAALVAALGYMFAGKWLLHILAGGHYIMIPLAWLPLVLLLLERAICRQSLLSATWAGLVCAGIILGTHPQMTLYAGLFVAVWTFGVRRLDAALDLSGASQKPPHSTLCWFGFGAWAAIVALALSAVQLLPALEAAPESSRAAGVAASEILASAMPTLLGLMGPGWRTGWEGQSGLGVLWLAAAVTAPILRRGRARFEAGFCLVMLAFGLGGAALLQELPGFRLFQIPGRMLMLLSLPIALLAGRTTQALIAGDAQAVGARARCRRTFITVLFAGLVLAAGSGLKAYSSSDEAAQLVMQASRYWLGVILAAPGVCWLLGSRCLLYGPAWRWTWFAVLLADAWALTWPGVAVRPLAEIYQPSACIQDLIERKKSHPEEHWRVLDRGWLDQPSSTPLGAALPMLGGVELEPVLGYNSFDLSRYKEYLQLISDEDQPLRPRGTVFGYPILNTFPIRNKAIVDLLGTRYLLQPRASRGEIDGRGEPGRDPAWRNLAEYAHPGAYSFLAGGMQALPAYVLYENRDAMPRAFVVERAVPLANRSRLREQLRSTNFRREALLDGIQEAEPTVPSLDNQEFTSARIREYFPNHVLVDVEAPRPGFLVLTDIWFPGWKCTVDRQPAVLHRADFMFRGVEIPAGVHEIVFTFAPASYQYGKWISGVALMVIAAQIILGWHRRRAALLS